MTNARTRATGPVVVDLRRRGVALDGVRVAVAAGRRRRVAAGAGRRPGAAARLQVGLAGCWLGLSLNPPRGWGRVVAHGLLSALLGLLCWALAALAGPNTLRNVLLYPITDGDDVARAWGGPSLAGAWAVHAALALVILPWSWRCFAAWASCRQG